MASFDLEQAFDCAICMDRLDYPKLLNCHHSFCENCLDNLIVFYATGNGTITCPFCNSVTKIDSDKTANDLPSNYQLQNVLDVINTRQTSNRKTNAECSYSDDCKNESTIYCSKCSSVFCVSCKDLHHKHVHNTINKTRYYPLKYDPYEEKTKIVCSEHHALGDYVCCEDIICVYCKHRKHASHGVKSTAQLAEEIKTRMKSSEDTKEINLIINRIKGNRLHTKEMIDSIEKLFTKKLFTRKLKCLIDYINLLNKEDERLLNEFRKNTKDCLSNFPIIKTDDEKYDFEIVLDSSNKKDKYRLDEISTRLISQVTFGLTNPSGRVPLGDIHVTRGSRLPLQSEQVKPFVEGDKSILDGGGFDLSLLVEEFNELVSNVLSSRPSPEDDEACVATKLENIVVPTAPIIEIDTNAETVSEERQNVIPSAPILTMEDETEGNEDEGENQGEEEATPSAPTLTNANETEGNEEEDENQEEEEDNLTGMIDSETIENALNKFNSDGLSYIYTLCAQKEEPLIACLLELSPSILQMRARRNYENTILHYAASHGCDRVLKFIREKMEYQPYINLVEKMNGGTALHLAVNNNQEKCVEELLLMNADKTVKNRWRQTPLAEARARMIKREILILLHQEDL